MVTLPGNVRPMNTTEDPDIPTCDNCGQALHRDDSGWWVGQDETSDCPDNERGHEVNGRFR